MKLYKELSIVFILFLSFSINYAQTASIGGMIITEEDESISEVTVDLLNANGNIVATQLTDEDGTYLFTDLPTGQPYWVVPSKTNDPLNGVSTFDLVMIIRHILGISPLDSPYKLLGADVNLSGSLTTLDLLFIRRVILQIDTEFPVEASWRFLRTNIEWNDPADPFSGIASGGESEIMLTEDVLDFDYNGIKLGDTNSSVLPN